jgi:putative CocE/NonD family hydrolase
VSADLKLTLSSTDADIIVKLIDVFPDDFAYAAEQSYIMNGYEMMVCADVLRGRYRESLQRPTPFVPGAITRINYTLTDVAHCFKKGHRIMVQVQSSWFPLVDPNPQQFINIYHAANSQFKNAGVKIFHDAVNSSNIILPVLKN